VAFRLRLTGMRRPFAECTDELPEMQAIKDVPERKEFDFPRGWSLKAAGEKLLRDGDLEL